MSGRLSESIELSALGAAVEDTRPIELGVLTSGTLSAALRADVFTITLQRGNAIRISTTGVCPRDGSFAITLVSPSGRAVNRTRGPDCGSMSATALAESGQYQLRVFDSGGITGDYQLQVDDAPLLSCQATEVAPNDDESSPEIALPFEVDFFGRRFSSLWVNNNGNVTFDGPESTFTPFALADVGFPIVAAWWADVDTRAPGSRPIRYGFGNVEGRRAFCVDYDRVGYFSRNDDRLNRFQLFLVDRTDVAAGAFDIVLRYTQLQWETGDASGGTGGLGGTSAGVGYSNGTRAPGTFFEIRASRQPGALLDSSPTGLSRTSTNADDFGLHILPIRP